MIVDMCMTRGVETVTPETSLGEAVHRMNDRKRHPGHHYRGMR